MQTSNNAVKNVKVPKKRKPRRHTLTDIDLHILGLIALSSGRPISKKEIIDQAHCSIRSADRAVGRLKNAGLIEVIEHYDESGARLANSYVLTAQQKDDQNAQ